MFKIPCNDTINSYEKSLLFIALAYSQNAYLVRGLDINNKNYFDKLMKNTCPNLNCTFDYYGRYGLQDYITGTCNDLAIIAFSGTESPALGLKLSAQEWMKNVNILKGKIADFVIHKGFLDESLAVYHNILEIVKYYKSQNKKIIFTGHSRGGATCQITALLLKLKDDIMVDYLITFGAPQPFYNKAALDFMNTYFCDRTIHVEAKYDPVTKIFAPFSSNGCPKKTIIIDSGIINSHGTNNYIRGLNLTYGCKNKNNICGCALNLKDIPLFPGGGTPSDYSELEKGRCEFYRYY